MYQISLLAICIVFFKNTQATATSMMSIAVTDSHKDYPFRICGKILNTFKKETNISMNSYILIDIRDITDGNLEMVIEARIGILKMENPLLNETYRYFSIVISEDKEIISKISSLDNIYLLLITVTNVSAPVYKFGLPLHHPVVITDRKVFNDGLYQHFLRKNATGLLGTLYPINVGLNCIAPTMLFTFAALSIVVAGILCIQSYGDILVKSCRNKSKSRKNSKLKYCIPLFFILTSVTSLLLAYFFFDYIVYVTIALFMIGGACSIPYILSVTCFNRLVTSQKFVFRLRSKYYSFVTVALFFTCLSLPITWCIYRNDPNVGWILQDLIGIFIIIFVLVDLVSILNFKIIVIFFALALIYDVFFVFVTPYFKSVAVANSTDLAISRAKRSTESIMEAVVTGSAGSSKERLPLVFMVPSRVIRATFTDGCLSDDSYSILGFGDAVIPGILCAHLAFRDAFLANIYYPYFVTSIIGYFAGAFFCVLSMFSMGAAQPALLYLCPCTLGFVVVFAFLKGGLMEVKQLWAGPPSVSPESDEILPISGNKFNPPSGDS